MVKDVSEWMEESPTEFFPKMFIWLDLLQHDIVPMMRFVHKIGDKVFVVYDGTGKLEQRFKI